MPITIPDGLPAAKVLQHENIFCISSSQAEQQDIRPMRILLLNLMPKKIETEIHLLRMLSNTPLQVDVELMRINDRPSRNTPIEHMETFYKDFHSIREQKYDGMIITGAPLGQVAFADVNFMEPMKEILDWTTTNVTSTMLLCWAAQAAMFHLYGVDKHLLQEKISGVNLEVACPPGRGEHFHAKTAVTTEQMPGNHRLGVGIEELLAVMNRLQAPEQLAELRMRGPTKDLVDHRGIETVLETIQPAGRTRD